MSTRAHILFQYSSKDCLIPNGQQIVQDTIADINACLQSARNTLLKAGITPPTEFSVEWGENMNKTEPEEGFWLHISHSGQMYSLAVHPSFNPDKLNYQLFRGGNRVSTFELDSAVMNLNTLLLASGR